MADVIFESEQYDETRAKLLADPVIKAMADRIHADGKAKSDFLTAGGDTPEYGFMLTALEKYKEIAAYNGRAPLDTHIGGPAEAILALAFPPAYDTLIADLELTTRTANALLGNDIETVGDLVRRTELDLTDIRNFGVKSLDEVKAKLAGLADKGVRGLRPMVPVHGPGDAAPN